MYVQQSPGCEDGSNNGLCLSKSSPGLQPAPRVWHQTLTAFLFELGCKPSQSDGALFTPSCGGDKVFLLLYVEDLQIAVQKVSTVEKLKQKLLYKFPGRDLGETQFFLQMSIVRDRCRRTVALKQQRHIEKLVKDADLDTAHPLTLPMIPTICRDTRGALIEDPDAITQYKSSKC
jgi:hypothetical protein